MLKFIALNITSHSFVSRAPENEGQIPVLPDVLET